MVRLLRNRLIGRLLLAVYALSTIAAGSFHDHGHRLGSSCSHGEHAGGELALLHEHDSGSVPITASPASRKMLLKTPSHRRTTRASFAGSSV